MEEQPELPMPPLRSSAMEWCVDPEVLDWYRLSPQERWTESMRLWDTYLFFGGRLDPEPDPQSPFYEAAERQKGPADDRQGLNSVRRGGV